MGWRAVSNGGKAEEGAVGKAVSPQEPRGRRDAEWRPDTEEQRAEGTLATGPQAHRGRAAVGGPGEPPRQPTCEARESCTRISTEPRETDTGG